MRIYTVLLTLGLLLIGSSLPSQAQRLDPTPGQSIFTVRGYGHSGLEFLRVEGENAWENSFVGGSFNPIFLWRQSSRLIFESELKFEFEDNALEVALEYANVAYALNQHLIVRVGRFLLPFGKFSSNFHPAWINRFPTAPLGFGHDAPVGPSADFGVEVRGATALRGGRFTYAAYVVNGPALNTEPGQAGRLTYGRIEDNNTNKAIGGRISILPLSDLTLEIGISAQYGKVGAKESNYKDIAAQLYSLDVTFKRNLTPLSSILDIRSQYNRVQVDRTTYPGDLPGEMVTFNNTSEAFYIQSSLRPAYIDNPLLKNLEFVGRYSQLKFTPEAPWGQERSEIALGVNYWIDWRTVVKFSYLTFNNLKENNLMEEEDDHGIQKRSPGEEEMETALLKQIFTIHVAIGF